MKPTVFPLPHFLLFKRKPEFKPITLFLLVFASWVKFFPVILLTLLSSSLFNLSAQGNFCTKAIPVSCGQFFANQTTVGGANSISNYSCISATPLVGPEKVYKITLSQTSDLQIGLEILDSGLDLDLFLLSDNCTAPNCISKSSSDNSNSNKEGIYAPSLAPGTYYIVVDGEFSNSQGKFNIDFACGKINCASPVSLACGVPYSSSTSSGRNDVSMYKLPASIDINNSGKERIHQFSIGKTATVSITLSGIASNTDLELFLLANCSAESAVASSTNANGQNETITVQLNAGTYFVAVDGYNGSAGNYTLKVECGGCPEPENTFGCNLIKPFYSGDGTNLRFTFSASQNMAPGYKWKIIGNGLNITDGAERIYSYTFPSPGTYQVCYPYLNETGCVQYCCINLCVANPFDCNSLISSYVGSGAKSWRFTLQGSGFTNIEWRNDATGQSAGSGYQSNLIPVPNPCSTSAASVSVSFFDGSCYRFCGLRYNPCNLPVQNCSSCSNPELTEATLIRCEGFENYLPNTDIVPQGGAFWKLWSNAPKELARVVPFGGQKALFLKHEADKAPDVLYLLGNQTSGRFRLSWKMNILPGKAGYFNIQHNEKGAQEPNWAFEVFFLPDNSGELYFGNNEPENKAPKATFFYPSGNSFSVMQIIDLDKNLAELWIDNEFVHAWKFSTGNPADLNQLGAINFYANENSEFLVDDICVWKANENCHLFDFYGNDPVTVKNGQSFPYKGQANICYLYTSAEFTQNISPTICDLGGAFLPFPNSQDTTTFVPELIASSPLINQFAQCARPNFNYNYPDSLYAKIFILNPPRVDSIVISTRTQSATDVEIILFSCSNNGDDRDIASSISNCISPYDENKYYRETGNYLTKFYGITPNRFYYVAVLSKNKEPFSLYTNSLFCSIYECIEDFPESPTLIASDTSINATLTDRSNDWYDGYSLPQCYNGAWPFSGKDWEYKFQLDNPKLLTISLESQAAMGLFLYDYILGGNCLAFSGNSETGGKATMGPLYLLPGEYHLVVDKADAESSPENFTLRLESQDISASPSSSTSEAKCPTNPSVLAHKIKINNLSTSQLVGTPFRVGDRINFFHTDESGKLKPAGSKAWAGNALEFNLLGDLLGDAVKCGYNTGEQFTIKVGRGALTFDALASYQPVGNEISTTNAFAQGGLSIITKLQSAPRIRRLSLSANQFEFNDEKGARFVDISSNIPWNIRQVNAKSWIEVNLDSTNQAFDQRVEITVEANPYAFSRYDTLFVAREDDEIVPVFIAQTGCSGAFVKAGPSKIVYQCAGKSTELTATGNGELVWSQGIVSPRLLVPPITQPATYIVSVTNNGCTALDSVLVVPVSAPFTAVPAPSPICPGETISISAPKGDSFRWSTNDTTESIKVSPLTTTSYRVTVTQAPCAASTIEITVQVTPKPLVNLGPDQAVCEGSRVTLQASATNSSYRWSNGFLSNSISPTITKDSTFAVTVTKNGCSNSDTVFIKSNPKPIVDAGPIINLSCSTLMATLNGTMNTKDGGNAKIVWQEDLGGKIISGRNTLTPIVADTGVYILTVENAQTGCSNSDYTLVSSPPKIISSIAKQTPAPCFGSPGGSAIVSVSTGKPPFVFSWSNGASGNSVNNLFAGNYTVTVSDAQSCRNALTVAITQPDPIQLGSVRIDSTAGAIRVDIFGGTPPYHFRWLNQNGVVVAQTKDVNQLNPGTYRLEVTDANGCSFSSSAFSIFGTTASFDPALQNGIRLFPNPSGGQLTAAIDLETAEILMIHVFDPLGRIVYAREHFVRPKDQLEFDLTGYPAGIFWVRIMAGGRVAGWKIFIQK